MVLQNNSGPHRAIQIISNLIKKYSRINIQLANHQKGMSELILLYCLASALSFMQTETH